ncbi:hypothetical protein BDA96_07G033000 [Sorghum bicolor]|uniref:Uncharacterized protein n=1 Tax=Sorghum bicolor TaxID=4558 RepID=A0A921QIU2_SORBI|nr:hypothetical protein BDA96_07G033000 [Sorghum bicolor]
MSRNVWSVLMILICILVCPVRIRGFSWNIFSSPSSSTAATGSGDRGAPMTMELDGAVADFAMDGGANNDPRGLRLLENARDKLAGPRNCWQEAYRKLFASCGEIMADKERQSRLAWHLTGCFQEDSGRPPFPPCAEGSKMVHCRKRLSESEGKVFLEFFLETNTLCHQLQAEAFKHNTERLINGLTRTSKSAEEKLEVIEDRSDQIIKESSKVHETLSSIEMQADNLAEASKHVGEQINDVLVHSKSISEQSKEIATTQAELSKGQIEMKAKIEAGMARVEESYERLGSGMDRLKEETGCMKREIKSVGESMSSKMQDLQRTADDIESVTGKSVENQMQLLNGQNQAMDGLNKLHRFQAQALEESRETIQKLAQFGQHQQEELLSRQEQIRQAHEHLIQNSHTILEAQEEFRLQSKAGLHFCCSGQAVHSAQCHSSRVSLHQGLLLLLLHRVPRLHAHQRKANVRHQGPTLLRSVHYASIGDWVDQNWRRRFRQAVPGHVQVVLAPNGVPRRCHCSDPALHIHLQGLRSAEPWAAADAGGEGPGAGGERRREGAVVRLGVGGGEPEGLLVGLRRRAGRRGGQQDGPNVRPAAAGAVASNPKAAQRNRRGGGDRRRELHHDVGLPEV